MPAVALAKEGCGACLKIYFVCMLLAGGCLVRRSFSEGGAAGYWAGGSRVAPPFVFSVSRQAFFGPGKQLEVFIRVCWVEFTISALPFQGSGSLRPAAFG